MKLRCRLKGMRCPSYKHEGIFETTDETLNRFEPDLNQCAECMAYANPAFPSLQEDLVQIGRITLWEKGPSFDPNHEQKASFRSYILPWICGALTRAKKKEVHQCCGFLRASGPDNTFQESSEAHRKCYERVWLTFPNRQTHFVDGLIWEMWRADFEKALPQLLRCLTKREQQVFTCIRKNMQQVNIAERLELSKPRVNQLLKQVELKLIRECQNLGLIE